MPSIHPRCVQHGLVVAPDGLCVLCRRQTAASVPDLPQQPQADPQYAAPLSAAQPPAVSARKLSAALLLLAAGVALALKWSAGIASEESPKALSAQPPKLAPSAQSELTEQEKAKAADLAASLKMLERAEADQQKKLQLAAAQAEREHKQAQAVREQEDKDRDHKRHELVARDLDAQALLQGRRNVQITLYGTDWCGVCQRARAYMRDKNIPFKDFDIDEDDAARTRAQALNPRLSVPTIAIDKELLIGFGPEAFEDRITRAARARVN